MSEELDNKQEIKKKPSTKKIENIEQTVKQTEQYQYVPKENEELIMDKPSEPLSKKDSPVIMRNEKVKINVKSNKELYESYINELKYFSLSLNGEIIYDSKIDKSKESPVKFENDYFILYGKKYSYNGLKIQKIN